MIKYLTQEEAAQLRKMVLERFSKGHFNGAGIRISQHKKSYEVLAQHIISMVPNSESAISTNRLRKFFFYTNPELCSDEKLEPPNFGNDFFVVLLQYIKTNNNEEIESASSSQEYKKSPGWGLNQFKIYTLIAVFSVGLIIYRFVKWEPEFKGWEEPFDHVTSTGLNQAGFKILDYDSTFFKQQIRSGCLTLYTLPGDYWVKEGKEKPKIANLLYKKIGSNNCVITTVIKEFDPYQNAQQAGIFLLSKDIDLKNCFRVTFAYFNPPFKVTPTNDTSCIQKIQAVVTRNEKEEEFPIVLRYPEFNSPMPETGLSLILDHNKVIVRNWYGDNESPIGLKMQKQFDLPFTPYYLGLAAFQGISDPNGKPLNADTLPAFFEYIKVEK